MAARVQKSVEQAAASAPTPPGPIRLGTEDAVHDEAMVAPVPMEVPSELAEASSPVRGREVESETTVEVAPRRQRRWGDGADLKMLI